MQEKTKERQEERQEKEAPSAIGNESYNTRFAAFLQHTNQKVLTAKILEALLQQLKERASFLERDSLSVLDVGCGEGTLAKQVVQTLQKVYTGTINYTGLDYNAIFVERFRNALSSFSQVNVASRQADVFSAETFNTSGMDMVIASHMIYHSYHTDNVEMSRRKATAFINNISSSLKENGIALLIHESGDSDMRELGTRYGSPLMPDAPSTIQDISKEQEITFLTIPFNAELQFPLIRENYWDFLKKDIRNASIIRQIPELNTTLLLLGFVVQRDLADLTKEDKLENFVEDIKVRLASNGNNCLIVRSSIQVLLSKEKSQEFEGAVGECCAAVKETVAGLQKEFSRTSQREYAL